MWNTKLKKRLKLLRIKLNIRGTLIKPRTKERKSKMLMLSIIYKLCINVVSISIHNIIFLFIKFENLLFKMNVYIYIIVLLIVILNYAKRFEIQLTPSVSTQKVSFFRNYIWYNKFCSIVSKYWRYFRPTQLSGEKKIK